MMDRLVKAAQAVRQMDAWGDDAMFREALDELFAALDEHESPQVPGGLARYEHVCAAGSCTYLGRFKEYDLYHCPQGGAPTVIARYGDGSEYLSGATDQLPSLAEAMKRARRRGLPVEIR